MRGPQSLNSLKLRGSSNSNKGCLRYKTPSINTNFYLACIHSWYLKQIKRSSLSEILVYFALHQIETRYRQQTNRINSSCNKIFIVWQQLAKKLQFPLTTQTKKNLHLLMVATLRRQVNSKGLIDREVKLTHNDGHTTQKPHVYTIFGSSDI